MSIRVIACTALILGSLTLASCASAAPSPEPSASPNQQNTSAIDSVVAGVLAELKPNAAWKLQSAYLVATLGNEKAEARFVALTAVGPAQKAPDDSGYFLLITRQDPKTGKWTSVYERSLPPWPTHYSWDEMGEVLTIRYSGRHIQAPDFPRPKSSRLPFLLPPRPLQLKWNTEQSTFTEIPANGPELQKK